MKNDRPFRYSDIGPKPRFTVQKIQDVNMKRSGRINPADKKASEVLPCPLLHQMNSNH